MTGKPPFLSTPTNLEDFAIGQWKGMDKTGVATGILYPPRRMQRKRVKGWRMPPGCVYVGRGSIWGNPFREGEHWRHGALRVSTGNVAFNTQLLKAFGDRKMTRQDCVDAYRIYLDYAGIPAREGYWPEPKDLRGKNLACWCDAGPCHADILLEMANA